MIVQQSARGHDHAGLAKSALRHIFREPGALTRMRYIRRQAFDREETATSGVVRRNLAGSNGSAIFEHSARTTNADTAAELCAGKRERITDHPDERHVLIHVKNVARSVHRQGDLAHAGIRPATNDLRSFSDSGSADLIVAGKAIARNSGYQ